MRNLFLVDGAFGSGKLMLQSFINQYSVGSNSCYFLKKDSYDPRGSINCEFSVDLRAITEQEHNERMESAGKYISYPITSDNLAQYYHINTDDLVHALDKYENVFVVVRRKDAAKIRKFPDRRSVNIVNLFLRSVGDDARLLASNDQLFRDRSMQRREKAWAAIVSEQKDRLQIVMHDFVQENFNRKLLNIVETFSYDDKCNQFFSDPNREKIVNFLSKRPFHRNVFLMSPIGGRVLGVPVREAKKRISRVCEKHGFHLNDCSIKSEELPADDNVRQKGLALSSSCGIAILKKRAVDDPGENENIFFEIGLMAASGKEVLVLAEKDEGVDRDGQSRKSRIEAIFSLLSVKARVATSFDEVEKEIEDWIKTRKVELYRHA